MSRWQPVNDIAELQQGDIVRGTSTMVSYTVAANHGVRVTAVRTADITNPGEWEVWRDDTIELARDLAVRPELRRVMEVLNALPGFDDGAAERLIELLKGEG